MKAILSLMVVVSMLFFMSCATFNGGSKEPPWEIGHGNCLNAAKWKAVKNNMVLITTYFLVQGWDDVVGHQKRGIGICLGDGLILALSHVTDDRFGNPIIRTRHFIGSNEISLIGRDSDISLFRTDMPFSGLPFAKLRDMEIGREVLTRGWSLGSGHNVKRGIISLVDVEPDSYFSKTRHMSESFVMTIPTNPGDSGAPVVIDNHGRYEIIGVTWGTMSKYQGLSFAFRLDTIEKSMNKILEGE